MKLAEALLLRRDLESKLTLLREEIASSAVIQEGDTLDRSIDDLLLDYETTNQEFAQLVIAINQRNAVAKIGEQETIAAAETGSFKAFACDANGNIGSSQGCSTDGT